MKDYLPSVALIMKGDKFDLDQCSNNDLEKEQMKNIIYTSVVENHMYAWV